MTRDYDERPLQDLINLTDTYLFQRILWTKLAVIQGKEDLAKQTTHKKEFDDYDRIQHTLAFPADMTGMTLKDKVAALKGRSDKANATDWGKLIQSYSKEKDEIRKQVMVQKITANDIIPDTNDKVSLKTYIKASLLYNKLKTKTNI